MGGATPQSGLVMEIPEAEAVVAHHRRALDANARLGVPAHVTVLFPFVPPALIDGAVLARLEHLLGAFPAFDYRFARTAWFGSEVLWLAPDDPEPFRALTERVAAAWPQHPPFEGAFAEVVPHLTVGHGVPAALLRAAERAVAGGLPLSGRATGVTLLVQDAGDGRWRTRATFPLGD